jgi:hypothetical protein
MQVLYQRCAGIDVHKDQVTVAALPGAGPGGRDTQVRKFRAFYGVLREMTRWLASLGIIWYVLTDAVPSTELGADFYTRHIDPQQETRRLIARLEALGYKITIQLTAAWPGPSLVLGGASIWPRQGGPATE